MSDGTPTYQFTEEVQKRILGLLLRDPDLDLGVLEGRYFADPRLEHLCETLRGFRRRYGVPPSGDALSTLLYDSFSPEDTSIPYPEDLFLFSCEVVSEIEGYDYSDLPYYRDLAVSFAKHQRLLLVLEHRDQYLQDGRYEDLKREIVEAVEVGEDRQVDILSLRDFHVWRERAERRRRAKMPTGFSTLDQYLDGGFAPGELVSIMAPPNGGKTRFLLALATTALLRGFTPFFVTVELANDKLAVRVAQALSRMTRASMFSDERVLEERFSASLAGTAGDIVFLEFMPGVSTLSDVKKECERLAASRGRPPIIYIDYVDKLRPDTAKDRRNHELEDQYIGLFAWAKEWDVPVVTASQTNREAVGRETIDIRHLGEAFAKAAISDVVLALVPDSDNRTHFRVFLAKNRDGTAQRAVDFQVDEDSQWISERST